jgi:hypothetical protein
MRHKRQALVGRLIRAGLRELPHLAIAIAAAATTPPAPAARARQAFGLFLALGARLRFGLGFGLDDVTARRPTAPKTRPIAATLTTPGLADRQ